MTKRTLIKFKLISMLFSRAILIIVIACIVARASVYRPSQRLAKFLSMSIVSSEQTVEATPPIDDDEDSPSKWGFAKKRTRDLKVCQIVPSDNPSASDYLNGRFAKKLSLRAASSIFFPSRDSKRLDRPPEA